VKLKEAYQALVERLSTLEEPHFAQLEAREILSYLLNLPPLHLHLYPERELSPSDLKKMENILKERLTLRPLPYILKRAYFFGRPFYLEEGVLIPRQDSEVLIEVILEILSKRPHLKQGTFLELGCGSGVLAITLLLEVPSLKGFALDLSEKALKVTRENARLHRVSSLRLIRGDWFSPFKIRPSFDFILSNPPYLSQKEWEGLSLEVKLFEPREALLSGKEGTEYQERLMKEAPSYLKQGGFLIFEMGYNQAPKIEKLARDYQWHYKFFRDLQNFERVALLWKGDI